MNEEIIEVEGKISNELFYSEDSNFGVYIFSTQSNIESDAFDKSYGKTKIGTISGKCQRLEVGNTYKMELSEQYSKKYQKLQFSPIKILQEIPQTESAKRVFLSSILSRQQTDTLLENYPDIIQNIIDGVEIDISVLKNFNEKRFQNVKEKIQSNYVLSDLLVYFSPFGITFQQVKKIATLHSNPSLVKEMIEKNPYILIKIDGFGFKKVDEIALKLCPYLKNSEERVIAFLNYLFASESDSNGHTWLTRQDIIGFARKNIPECIDTLKECLESEKNEPNFLRTDGDRIGRIVDYNVEKAIFNELERINSSSEIAFKFPTEEQINSIVNDVEERQGFKFSEEQMSTLGNIKDMNRVIIVSGSSGTGKSTVVNAISDIFEKCQEDYSVNISQIALSAKASIRLKQITGRYSTTIHKFLYDLQAEASDKNSYDDVDFDDLYAMGDITDEEEERIKNLEQIRKSDIVIIDEFSMVNIYLTLDVLKQVKDGAVVVFVFDYAQLPSIGAGAVAYDLLECSNYNKSKFTSVHRQGQNSGILMDANMIRQQLNPLKGFSNSITTGISKDMTYLFRSTKEDINETAIKAFISGVEKFGIDNINIICPRKDRVLNSADELNKRIQNILLPKGFTQEFMYGEQSFRLGDKVIHKKNMSRENVYNGEIGTIISINKDDDEKVVVKYSYGDIDKIIKYDTDMLKYLKLAYALTVHSYQGSENKAIIVVLDSASHILLDNTMLYTAITRAKERCILISDPNSFMKCIKEHKTLIRNTWLKDILRKGE